MASKRSILRKVKLGMMEMPTWLPNIFPKEFDASPPPDPVVTEEELAELRQQQAYNEALKKVEEKKATLAAELKKTETKPTPAPKTKPNTKTKIKTTPRKKSTKVKRNG